MNQQLLNLYRLSAYFAANENDGVSRAQDRLAVKIGGAQFYRNCVLIHDPKGKYLYESMRESLDDDTYRRLRTRYTFQQQREIIAALDQGLTIAQTAANLGHHYHPITYFSLVYRMAFRKEVNLGNGKWCPYSAECYKVMADQIRVHRREHGTFPTDTLQPELLAAIQEVFVTGTNDPLHQNWRIQPASSHAHLVPADTTPLPTAAEPSIVPAVMPSVIDVTRRLDRIEDMLVRLLDEAQSPIQNEPFSKVEHFFSLDVCPPQEVQRWLSRAALQLFNKLIRGGYNPSRDEDTALFELEEFGLIEMPHVPSKDLMGGVTVCRDQLMITNKGWSLRRLIQDICEQAVYCCLSDLGGFMGLNVHVTEADD